MHVEKLPFDDSAEPGADGFREYLYRGVTYDFADDTGGGFIVRSYDDTPEEASFIAHYDIISGTKMRTMIDSIPYEDTFFASVALHLVTNEGKKKLTVLTERAKSYEHVELAKIIT